MVASTGVNILYQFVEHDDFTFKVKPFGFWNNLLAQYFSLDGANQTSYPALRPGAVPASLAQDHVRSELE